MSKLKVDELDSRSASTITVTTTKTLSVPAGATLDVAGTANLTSSTLSACIDAAVTTIPLTSTTGFPATGTVGVGTEQITYTGVAGNTLTGGTRGANSTTAAAHLSAAAIGTVFSTPSNYNALSAGPVGIAVGSTITLGTDSVWTVV